MAIRKIRLDGEDVLRKECKPIEKMTPRLATLIDDMYDTMYEANGVGLAAPQVGVLKRLVVIDIGEDNPLTLINPVIIQEDGEQEGEEGCLSLPGLQGTVVRPNHVVCKALNEDMEEIIVEGEGLLARAICHELDHLDGILYKDKTLDGLYSTEAPAEN
ncbi:MAG: peptide deformylase [Lachnospiraceae bacterium]|nr:peptide deformylase [Lachnospiraceae bacterium]